MIARQYYHPRTACRRLPGNRELRDIPIFALLALTAGLVMLAAGTTARNCIVPVRHTMNTKVTVRHGDTIWSIAQRYGNKNDYILRRVSDIVAANKLDNDKTLHEGQVLTVPTGE